MKSTIKHIVMLRMFAFIFTLFPFTLTACGDNDMPIMEEEEQEQQNTKDMTTEQREIVTWLDRWDRALVEQDVATLDRLMADDMMLVHLTGAMQTKQEWLAEVEAGTMRYYSIKKENLSIAVDGDYATARYVSIIDANIWGSHGTWRLNSTMHLEKTGADWIRINPHQ